VTPTETPTQYLGRAELTVDVSADLPFGERILMAASVHLPDLDHDRPTAILVCWPGGSYSRVYWDMQISGHPGYSFAEHMTAAGFVVVAVDHLGVGESSKPADGDRVTLGTMGAAAAAFVAQLRTMLADGVPELGGMDAEGVPVIGVGHSLGACIAIVTQARHRSYDGVALLGFTHGQKDAAVTAVGADAPSGDESRREAAIQQARAFFGDTWDDVYGAPPREPNHGWLYRPEVPAAVIAADDATAARWPRQSYVEALLEGHSTRFAAEVDCDVFLAFGDHDVPPEPHADVAYYAASHDVTLYVLRDSGHCHNFASTRGLLWDRMGLWAAGQARRAALAIQ
jgi:pimeloyl-ACP methyl ester carboxylesterase